MLKKTAFYFKIPYVVKEWLKFGWMPWRTKQTWKATITATVAYLSDGAPVIKTENFQGIYWI